MTAWPRTFFARNLLLIIGMFFVGQICSWILFVTLIQQQRMDHFAPFIVAQSETIRLALQNRSPQEQVRFVQSLQHELGNKLYFSTTRPAPVELTQPHPLVRWFVRILRSNFPSGQVVLWQSEPKPILWVQTQQHAYVEWVGFPAEGFALNLWNTVLIFLSISVVVALAGAWLIQFGLISPLKALESAALQIGRTGIPHFFNRPMPQELAEVANSFNIMQDRLRVREQERTLMLAGISHDLRTPLTKMWLGVEMLRGKADADVLDRITASVRVADRIIAQFIDFAREGNAEPMMPINLAELIRNSVQESTLLPETVQIECEEMPACMVRATAVRRIIGNLINNAASYGAPPIFINAVWSQGQLYFSVLDNGPGIPEERLLDVLRPFVRLDQHTDRLSGSGLGLSIVQRLVEAHGGRIVLHNHRPGGLKVEVWLDAAMV